MFEAKMNQRTFKLGLLLSLLIHLGMVLSSFVLPKLFPPKSEKIELSYLSADDLKKLSELQKKPDVTNARGIKSREKNCAKSRKAIRSKSDSRVS